MSILRSKHNGWTWEMTRTPFMGGGGGGGQPTQTTSYSTNVPEYARPYVENMLQSTQKQIYTDDMAGFRPYRPYSTDVNQYFAGFSPMQQQAQQATAQLQTPGQYGTATGLAGLSGLGALGAGQQYAQNVTSPQSMQAYMSPYQQSVTDVAKTAAVREAQMAQQAQNLGAARQGTYGGARQTLAQAEREKNLLSNLSNIQAQGSQSAYDRALQSQQFGANLGLQGYGQAGQAASTLGQLGGQQLGAQKEIIGLQSQMGKEQQALEQNKINQAIQDYAIAQQYPFMQLAQMNAMLRGLPMQTQTTQLYQAQPSALQQGIGLAGAAGSLFGGKAAGGAIKEYRQGGIVGYAPGGVIDSTRADLEQIAEMPDGMRRLEQIRNSSDSDAVRKMAAEIIAQKQIEAKVEQQTQQARMSGIAAAGGPAFESINMAGGGILAFSNGGGTDRSAFQQDLIDMFGYSKEEDTSPFERDIKPKLQKVKSYFTEPRKYTPEQLEDIARKKGALGEGSALLPGGGLGVAPAPEAKPETKPESAAATKGTSGKAGTAAAKSKEYKDFLAELKEVGPKGQAGAEYEKYLTERLGKSGERLSRDERMAMAKGFLKFASTPAPGGIGQAAAAGLGEYATGIEAARKSQDTMEAEAQKARMELDKARRAEQRGDAAGAREAYDKYEDRMSRIQAAQIGAGAAGAPQRYTEQQIRNVMAENPGMSYGEAMTRVAGAGRMENVEVQRAKAALASIDESLGLMGKKDPRRAELEAQRAEIIRLLTPGGGVGGGQATQTSAVVPKDIQSILSKYPQR